MMCGSRMRDDLFFEARKKPVHHHLRRRAEETLAHPRDESADLALSGHIHDGRVTLFFNLDLSFPFAEARLARALHDQPVRVRRLLVENGDGPGVLTADRG